MAIFDYADKMQNVSMLVSSGLPYSYISPEVVSPSSKVMFQSFFNPGHNGKADWIDFYFNPKIYVYPTTQTVIKFQIYNNGGSSWITLATTTRQIAAGSIPELAGVYATSAKMPLRFRMTLTSPSTRCYIQLSSAYHMSLRAVGTAT